MTNRMISALLVGDAKTSEKARLLAEKYRNCPYVYFIATKDAKLFAIYFLPEKQRWWIESIKEKPSETIGLEKVEVTFADGVFFPEKIRMRLPERALSISPCQSNCRNCPYYGQCPGCPSTIFHEEEESD